MFPQAHKVIPLQNITDPLLRDHDLSLQILRTDQTDPVISGNKWFKLKYNFIEAREQGYQTLLSFGGPYSNHIHALAAAGKACGFNTIGIIRGEEHQPLNPTLSDAVAEGMKLYYVDRQTYRNKHTPLVLEQLKALIKKEKPFGNNPLRQNNSFNSIPADEFYLVPEGGTNELAVKGAAEIAAAIPADCDYVCIPLGTGGTAAGIITGLTQLGQRDTQVLGFAAMKGGEFLEQVIQDLLDEQSLSAHLPPWQLFYDYHFGGYAKIDRTLAEFIQDFVTKYAIELEPVYTGKMMYAIFKLINEDYFPKESKIIAIHTGGLQGNRGMKKKLQTLLK